MQTKLNVKQVLYQSDVSTYRSFISGNVILPAADKSNGVIWCGKFPM